MTSRRRVGMSGRGLSSARDCAGGGEVSVCCGEDPEMRGEATISRTIAPMAEMRGRRNLLEPLLLHALDVAAFGGIHAHFVAGADEWRDVDDQAGFEFRRLHHRAGGRFLDAG